jgi:hypothetical protein
MLCYRDMTFCTEDTCARWDTCPRSLTPEVRDAARQWWGGDGAPICAFVGAPKCFARHATSSVNRRQAMADNTDSAATTGGGLPVIKPRR